MSTARKTTFGLLSLIGPVGYLVGFALFAVLDSPVGFAAFFVGVLGDELLVLFLLPHIHENPSLSDDGRMMWVGLCGFPGIVAAPVYFFRHVLRPRPPLETTPSGWFRDPWGMAAMRWYDSAAGWTAHTR